MIFRSGDNLFKESKIFIDSSDSIILFSAYLKLETLKKINTKGNIKQIIVRWEIQDLCVGASDIELYNYCLNNKISLFRNTRLHMKAIWNNNDSLLYGSANITGRGIEEKGNYNYELNGIQSTLSFNDLIYLKKVIASSEYVSERLYNKLESLLKSIELPVLKFPELPSLKKEIDNFLISQLPMSSSPKDLYEVSVNNFDYDSLQLNYAAHDTALFSVNCTLEYSNFINELKEKFNCHPFIKALKEYIKSLESKSLRYGGVVEWIQDNTTTVPVPRRWDIKKDQIVNILYTWICFFDDDYTWERPNHSQVIFYKKTD